MRVGVLALVLFASSCGGGGNGDDDGDAHYSRADAEKCLKQSPLVKETRKWEEGNQLPRPAGEGELEVTFKRNELALAFDRNATDAKSREADLQDFNENFDRGSQRSLVRRKGNAVLEWGNTPTKAEEDTLARCLTAGAAEAP